MNIEATKGTKVRFIKDNYPEAVSWGNNDNPDDFLIKGEVYTVEKTDIRSFHTKVILEEFKDKKFNSVHFEEVN